MRPVARARHLSPSRRRLAGDQGKQQVTIDESESPLAWLARRRGRDGRALIAAHQLQAGERLRADFTLAHLMPSVTSDLTNPVASSRRGRSPSLQHFTDGMVAARRRVHRALDAAGPEFAGLLLDVCCFLKRLEDIERERVWPARSAKVVLQLGLERLARHYGFVAEISGRPRARLRTWLAEGAGFSVDGDAGGPA
ncbi:MAG: DUF6456 domain-containing protein [Pseudolabrys sp.]